MVAMRVTSLAAGLLLAVAACGGEKKAPEQTAAADTGAAMAQTPSAQQAMTGTGTTVDVNMDFDGKVGKFDPASVTIKSGDVVRFHNHSGGPHNVAFDKDSIPAGAQPVLDKAMKDVIAPLTGPMLVQPDQTYEISFAGAPAGVYHVHCTPHLAFNMRGTVTVQ
jgi:plastocyanin